MDKATRALMLAEDRGEEIKLLRADIDIKTRVRVLRGAPAGGRTSFGAVSSSGGGVIVAFAGGDASLAFCGNVIASGGSPLIAELPVGNGELSLDAAVTATAMIIGGNR